MEAKKAIPKIFEKNPVKNDDFIFENEFLRLNFDQNGNLKQMDNLETGVSTPISQVYCIYKSMAGNNSDGEFQASGAYIFRPESSDCERLSVTKYSATQGYIVNEIHQVFNEWISQTIRLYKERRHVEVEWMVGPINVTDQIGREVVIKFETSLRSNGVFYTDSNGREMIKRVRDFRPTWKLNQTEPVSGNYYPINSRIYIRDEAAIKSSLTAAQFTVVTDRSQGGSSIEDGSVEIMLHRRNLHDDALGVSEPLNEPGTDNKGLIVKGSLFLVLSTVESSAKVHRELAHLVNNQPLIFFSSSLQSTENGKNLEKFLHNRSFLGPTSFPPNLHLLTFMRDFDYEIPNTYIIRIEHFYEIGEDSVLSEAVTIDLSDVFSFNIIGVEELALGANMKVEELNERLVWNSLPDLHFSKSDLKEFEKIPKSRNENQASFEFTFKPMQIRTFRVFIL